MQLSDFISEKLIDLDLKAKDKTEAFRTMIAGMAHHQAITNPEVFLDEIIAREAIQATSIGRGVAFPHTRTSCVKRPVIAFARSRRGIPFSDNEADDVNLIFVMGTPKDDYNVYLQILARLCRLLRQTSFRERLMAAASPKEVIDLFNQFDRPMEEPSSHDPCA